MADKPSICHIYIDPKKPLKTLNIRASIQSLISGKKYFTVKAVQKYLTAKSLKFKQQTVRQYLYNLKKDTIIYDAGYGWYSTIAGDFKPDTSSLTELVKLLTKKYPLLPFSCWSTAQIQGYSHHIPVRFTTLLYADSDDIMSLFEFLREENFNVFANPGKAETEKQFMIRDRTVVIRPFITEEPATHHYAAIEKLLVDLFVEMDRLMLMDGAEYERVARNLIGSTRINMAKMFRYAGRREMRKKLVTALHHADANLVCE